MEDRYIVAIGRKDLMSYITACLSCLHDDGGYAIIKARGRLISKAVDVVMMLKEKFIRDLIIKEVKIGTEHLPSADGKLIAKSWIVIRIENPRRRKR